MTSTLVVAANSRVGGLVQPSDRKTGVDRRLWLRALTWLVFLGPFFFVTYGYCNAYAARLDFVPSYFAEWERAIPFMPWLLLPYWTIDAFYAASLFTARDRQELDALGKRLMLATLISCAGFLMFPLRFAFEHPQTSGFNGWLLARLLDFDQPFNQAPSLHVSLLLILWVHYSARVSGGWRVLLHLWFSLIGVSVVGTFQHHMIDIYAGLAVGVLCQYLVPPLARSHALEPPDTRRMKIAACYGAGAAVLAVFWSVCVHAGLIWSGLLFAWGCLALCLVSIGYLGVGSAVFGKEAGRLDWSARCVLLPYLAGAWLSARLQNMRRPAMAKVAAGLWVGRLPRRSDHAPLAAARISLVLDLSAEFDRSRLPVGIKYAVIPVLDLTAPSLAQLKLAAAAIEHERAAGGSVLVCCALGLSRSACACAAALVMQGATAQHAVAQVRAAQPRAVLQSIHLALLTRLQN